jgi:hypothetical protein
MARLNVKALPPQAIRLEVEVKTADFQADNGKVYVVNPAGATMNIQLPAPIANFHCVIKDISGDLLNKVVTIVRNGSENIDGQAANKLVQSDYESITLFSNGADWFIL